METEPLRLAIVEVLDVTTARMRKVRSRHNAAPSQALLTSVVRVHAELGPNLGRDVLVR